MDVEPRPSSSVSGRHGRGYAPRSDRWRNGASSGIGGTSSAGVMSRLTGTSSAGPSQTLNAGASSNAGRGGSSSSSSSTRVGDGRDLGDFEGSGAGEFGPGGPFI